MNLLAHDAVIGKAKLMYIQIADYHLTSQIEGRPIPIPGCDEIAIAA